MSARITSTSAPTAKTSPRKARSVRRPAATVGSLCCWYTRMYVGDVIGYTAGPVAFSGLYVRSGATVAPARAALALGSDGATNLPLAFLIDANDRPAALASE